MESKEQELSDAQLEQVSAGMGKVAAMAVVSETRVRSSPLRVAAASVPRTPTPRTCKNGICTA